MSSARSMTCASRHLRPVGRAARAARRRPRGRRRRRRTCAGRGSSCRPGRAPRAHGYFTDASRLARVRLRPTARPSGATTLGSSRVSRRSVWALPSNPPMCALRSASARSPLWPNGGWPRSCARHAVSTTSGSQPSALPISRPTWATSSVWVRRVRTKSSLAGPEHLRLGAEPAQRRGVHEPRAVALERRARARLRAARGPSGRGRPRCRRGRGRRRDVPIGGVEVGAAHPSTRGRPVGATAAWRGTVSTLPPRRPPVRVTDARNGVAVNFMGNPARSASDQPDRAPDEEVGSPTSPDERRGELPDSVAGAHPAGRPRGAGRGQHRDRVAGPQRQAGRLGRRPGRRCSPRSTSSATSAPRSSRSARAGLVGLIVPELMQPGVPRVRPAHRVPAVLARVHPAAVHAVPGRHHRGRVRRDAPRPPGRRDRVRLRPARRHHREPRALPPAAQPRRADRAGQRLRRGRRRTRSSPPTTPPRWSSPSVTWSRSATGGSAWPSGRTGSCPRTRKVDAFTARAGASCSPTRPTPRTSSRRCSRSRAGRPPPPSCSTSGHTAIVCGSDLMALGAIRAARTLGLRVPEDVSVVGFDDSPLVGFTDPALTTVRQPVRGVADAAVDTPRRRDRRRRGARAPSCCSTPSSWCAARPAPHPPSPDRTGPTRPARSTDRPAPPDRPRSSPTPDPHRRPSDPRAPARTRPTTTRWDPP